MADPIVIVSAARTPIGGLLGDFASPRRLGARRRRDQGRGRARRRARRRGRRGADGQLPDGRPGPGAGAPGDARRRPARSRPAPSRCRKMCGTRHARDDVRARHAGGRQRRRDGRRRHGEHDQRAAPDVRAQGRQVRRRAAATTTWRSTAWRTPTSAARRWACFAEECVAKYGFTPRGDGPVRDRVDPARARRPTRTAASTGRWRR